MPVCIQYETHSEESHMEILELEKFSSRWGISLLLITSLYYCMTVSFVQFLLQYQGLCQTNHSLLSSVLDCVVLQHHRNGSIIDMAKLLVAAIL